MTFGDYITYSIDGHPVNGAVESLKVAEELERARKIQERLAKRYNLKSLLRKHTAGSAQKDANPRQDILFNACSLDAQAFHSVCQMPVSTAFAWLLIHAHHENEREKERKKEKQQYQKKIKRAGRGQ